MARYKVVELRSKVRITGYGVWDNEKGWLCETFKSKKQAKAYVERNN